MREEICEPQQWRAHSRGKALVTGSKGTRCQAAVPRSDLIASLPLEAVDAVFAEDSLVLETVRGSRRDLIAQKTAGSVAVMEQMEPAADNDLLQNLSAQLAMLKAQQEHLQELLIRAGDGRD